MKVNHVLDQIRYIRKKKGYSQESISYDLQITQNAYSKIECGHSALRLDTAVALSKVYNIKIIIDNGSVMLMENTDASNLQDEINAIKYRLSSLSASSIQT